MAQGNAPALVFREFYEELVGRDPVCDLLADEEQELDGCWGEDSSMIEEWFAAGDDLFDGAAWDHVIADGWEEGTVLNRPRSSPRLQLVGGGRVDFDARARRRGRV